MILEARDISKEYKIPGQKPIRVLDGVSFSVAAGERVAVMGRSGAGKTTLLNILGGLDRPTSGETLLSGRPVTAKVRASRIGFVFQNFHLLPELDVLENVVLPAYAGGSPRLGPSAARERARKLLAEAGLEDRMHHLPAELSGGEQQRVALVRAIMRRPALILADEPTGNLDSLTGSGILQLLFGLDDDARPAVVMVTHSAEAAAACDRTLILSGGKISPA